MIAHSLIRRLGVRGGLLLLAIYLLGGVAVAQETDTTTVSIAEQQIVQDSADAWVALIDSMEYVASWEQASAALQQQITQSQWEQSLQNALAPLGPLLSRAPQGREYTTTYPNAPKGEYIVITYGSSYTQLENAVETLVMVRNPAGTWKPAGYYVRPSTD
ncbi:MAG: DUF4019 domain-containing protein [Tunicatimonas sp.]